MLKKGKAEICKRYLPPQPAGFYIAAPAIERLSQLNLYSGLSRETLLQLVSFKHDGEPCYGVQADGFLQPPANFASRYPERTGVLRGNAPRELELHATGGTQVGRAVAQAVPVLADPWNDIAPHSWQRHTHQWTPGKNFPGTGPLGPWFVTADEVPDVNALTLETRLNGEVMQHASLGDLIFTIPVLIEYISRFTPLSPGDVIATGTPGGVGDRRDPPGYT